MNHQESAQVIILKKVDISVVIKEDIKRRAAQRKTALVLEMIQGKITVVVASRFFNLPPSEE